MHGAARRASSLRPTIATRGRFRTHVHDVDLNVLPDGETGLPLGMSGRHPLPQIW